MRSRYTAYALKDVDYLLATFAPERHRTGEREQIAAWASRVEAWVGLRIVSTSRGGPTDKRGQVEFEAKYREGGREGVLRERSRFERRDGKWLYLEGT